MTNAQGAGMTIGSVLGMVTAWLLAVTAYTTVDSRLFLPMVILGGLLGWLLLPHMLKFFAPLFEMIYNLVFGRKAS